MNKCDESSGSETALQRSNGGPQGRHGPNAGRERTSEPDACDYLDADHVAVDRLFLQYHTLIGSRTRLAIKQRAALAREICLILAVQGRLKQEVFYPTLQAAISVSELLAEVQVEHECAQYLLARIEQRLDVDIAFDALVKTLSVHVGLLVQKERSAIYPVARESRRLDLPLLRKTLEVRRQAIFREENDRLALRLQRRADEVAMQRERVLQKSRAAAKSRNHRRGAVVVYKLALTDMR